MNFPEVAVDLLMNAAQRRLPRERFQPSALGLRSDLVFPTPNVRRSCLLKAELDSLVYHRALPRARHSAAAVLIKPKRFGRIGGEINSLSN
jgi:hypothetical protein